jgi:hypothetical protein
MGDAADDYRALRLGLGINLGDVQPKKEPVATAESCVAAKAMVEMNQELMRTLLGMLREYQHSSTLLHEKHLMEFLSQLSARWGELGRMRDERLKENVSAHQFEMLLSAILDGIMAAKAGSPRPAPEGDPK